MNYKRKRCAPACRQQCTPLLLFERITMDHVGETGLMVSGWDVPRTEPVVRSRRFYAPLFSTSPLSTILYAIFPSVSPYHHDDRTADEQLGIPIPAICVTFHPTTDATRSLDQQPFASTHRVASLRPTGIRPTTDTPIAVPPALYTGCAKTTSTNDQVRACSIT